MSKKLTKVIRKSKRHLQQQYIITIKQHKIIRNSKKSYSNQITIARDKLNGDPLLNISITISLYMKNTKKVQLKINQIF